MRFYHIADVHLGASPDGGYPWGELRKKEIWDSFCGVIEQAEQERIDLLLIAGDLFHRQPLVRELKEVNYLFSKLTVTRVVLMAGNHDYLRRDSCYRGFPWNENVVFLDKAECEKIVFPDLQTAVYGFSYDAREIAVQRYQGLRPQGEEKYHILLAHGGDEKHIPISVNELKRSGFSYVALGHIHKPQILAEHRIAYAGALEPLDKNDLGVHGFIAGECRDGAVQIEFVPWAKRQYIPLTVTVDETYTDYGVEAEIKQLIQRHGSDHIYKITLQGYRDPDIIFAPEAYHNLGNVIEAADETKPAYDFDKLLQAHRDNMIGAYIERLYRPEMTDMEERALHYGVQALLETKR